jgi:hypothetical protein
LKGLCYLRAELTPLREEIDNAISHVGWHRARAIVEQVMGFPVPRQSGAWWSKVGKRSGQKLLEALAKSRNAHPARQASLFDDGPEAA